MTINCVSFVSLDRYLANRLTFESSSAASISSSRQNGDGLNLCIKKTKKIAVKLFSPPESCIIFCNFFPGGCAMILIPVSSRSSSSTSSRSALPPPNSSLNTFENITRISLNFSANCSRIARSSSAIIFTRFASALQISSCCPFKNSYRSDTCL